VGPEDYQRAFEDIARSYTPAGAPQAAGGAEEREEDPLDRLKKLTELRDAGALTQTEFEVQKAKILADL
jgi:hypothetical protein